MTHMNRILTAFVFATVSVAVIAVVVGESVSADPGRTGAAQQVAGQDARAASVWGTVRDAAGKPVDGALVSIRGVDQTFATSVYTDDNGEYVTPPLSARRYRMWAQTTGFGTVRAELQLDGRPASQAFTLPALDDITPQLTGAEWLDSLPAATAENRRMRQILRVSCSDCHSLAVVLQNRFDEAGWRILTRMMTETSHVGWGGRRPAGSLRRGVFALITSYHADELAAYLARVRGPGSSPVKLTPRPRPRGAAAQVVITEYDLPIGERLNELAWYDGTDWSQGPAVGTHGIVGPHDVLADLDGNAWIYESRTSFETHRTFTKLDPKTGKTTAFAVLRDGRMLSTEQIKLDWDGNIWATISNYGVIRWSPSTETMTPFPSPVGFPGFVNSLDTDPVSRTLWFNVFGGAARFDPATKKWQLFQSRTAVSGFSYGMAVDADGNGWWSNWDGDTVSKADIKTGTVTEIPMHDPEYAARKALATKEDLEYYESIGVHEWGGIPATPVQYSSTPRRMASDKRGTTVWVPLWAGQHIAEIDIRTSKVTYHKLPVNGHAYKVSVDAQHNVWASIPPDDSLVKYDPTNKSWTVYPFASHGCGPRHISVDDLRGEVWVPCDQSSKVSRFQFRTPEQIRSQKQAAQAN